MATCAFLTLGFLCITLTIVNGVQSQVEPPGHQVPVNTSDPKLHASVDVVVDIINRDRGFSDKIPRQICQTIENGTVQVVDGWMFRLRLIIADSVCSNTEANENKTSNECAVLSPGTRKRCQTAVIYNTWEDPGIDVLSYDCVDIQPTPPGEEMPINKSDPGVAISVHDVVNTLNRRRGYADIITRVSFGELSDGTVQITDGNIYRLQFTVGDSVCNNSINNWNASSSDCPLLHPDMKQRNCNATVLYKHWYQPMCNVTDYNCEPPPPGDQRPIPNKNSTDVIRSAEAAISIINYDRGYSNDTFRRILDELEGGTVQITDGDIFRLIFTIADSNCKNIEPNFNATSAQCPIPPGRMPVQRCEAEVLDRNWLPNQWFIQQYKCSNIPPPPLPPPSSVRPINPNDPGVAASVNAVVNKINEVRGYADIITRESLGEVVNGTVEDLVDEGQIYQLLFTIGNSYCNNSIYNANATSKDCPLIRTDHGLHTCNTSVIYIKKETTTTIAIISYHCEAPPGDERPINKSNPAVAEAADEAVNVINWDRGYSENIRRLTLYEVEAGTVQVVSGEMFKLIFTLSNSVCKNTEDNANATEKECPVEQGLQGLPVQRCESQIFYKHWLPDHRADVMEHSCVLLPPPTVPPGGAKEINRSDPGVAESVSAAVEVINQERGYADIIIRQTLGEVMGGTVQVVDGEIYRLDFTVGNSECNNSIININATKAKCPLIPGMKLRECNATVIYKHWEIPRSTVLSHLCQGPSPGDQVLINRTDPGVSFSINGAVSTINRDRGYSNESSRWTLYKLEGGTEQIVDGSVYRLAFTLSNSVCPNTEKYSNATSQECPPKSGEQGLPIQRCDSKVLYRYWLGNLTDIMEHECEPLPPPPPPRGGDIPYNKDDPHVITVTESAVDTINEARGYSDKLPRKSLVEILNGTYQMVDGELYHLKFSIGISVCNNSKENANKTSKDCPLIPHSRLRPTACAAQVIYKPWESFIQVVNWTCDKSINIRKDLTAQSTYVKMSGDFAANEINKKNGFSCCTYKYVVADILNPTSTLTGKVESMHMTLSLGRSFCTNNELNKDRTTDSCPLQPGLPITACDVTVLIHNGQDLSMGTYSCRGGDMATASPMIG
ncbi:uncharacterized protein LOC117345024 [Pecten maximus]|uniref:uncharacterized protein LOC117345024 n=1 Tax=Pecten maximus TaxID=6579 RepID=UPI001458826E|nr:uncharacterized protein LOC117345024 [Pecten maximus]